MRYKQLFCLGNIGFDELYHNDQFKGSFLGGAAFRVILAAAYFNVPTKYFSLIGKEKKWSPIIKKLSTYQQSLVCSKKAQESIRFVWEYQDNENLKKFTIKNAILMDELSQLNFQEKVNHDDLICLCPLGLKNELKIIESFAMSHHDIAYIFHLSNFDQEINNLDYFKLFKKITYLFINRHEASQLFDTKDMEKISLKLSTYAKYVILTLDKDGYIIAHAKKIIHQQKALNIKKLDSSGAGDFFAGATLASLIITHDLIRASKYGLTLASLSLLDYFGENIYQSL